MDAKITKICFLLSILNPVVLATDISDTNATDSDIRQPRVNGRIVKLYSGPRPEPIYCPEEGFQPDPVNCAIFYRCVKGNNNKFTVFRFQCGPGTVYDPDTEVCNFPQSTKRSECGGIAFPSQDKTNENEIVESRPEFPSPINTRPGYSEDIKESTAYPWAPPKIENAQSPSTAYPWMTSGTNQPSLPLKGTTIQEQLQINYGEKVSQTQTQISHGDGVIQNQTQINYGDHNENKPSSAAKQNQTQISHGSAVSQTQTQINHGNGVQTQLQIDHTKETSQSQSQTYETTSKTSTTSGTTVENEQDQVYGLQPSTEGSNGGMNNKNECTESGFMGDKNDCNKFYRCVDNGKGGYIKYEFQCGEGTVWDSSIEGCNHAWAVKNCGSSSSTDVTKEETTTTQSTPITVSLVQTTTQASSENIDYDSGYGQQPSEASSTTSTKNPMVNTKPTEQTTTGRPTPGKECSQEGFMGDNDDCNKFYRCVDNGQGGFTKYEFKCGEGTVWDSEITACNHPKSATPCSGGSSSQGENISENPQTSTTTQSSQTSGTQTTNEAHTTSKPSSTSKPPPVKDCSQEGFMGDENDCEKFYRCVDNGEGGFTKYEFTCGEGTVWDSEIQTCNHPSSSKKCGSSSSQTSDQQASTEPNRENDELYSESTNIQASSTEQSHTTSSSEKPTGSNDKCTSEGFYGDSNDCKKFYRCVDNGNGGFTKYEFTCGDGTVWDQEVQTCNYEPSDSKCSRDSPSQSQAESSDGTTSTTQSTIPEQQSTQKPQSSASNNCTAEGFYANTEDCKKFYRCVDNGNGGYTKYDFSCGEGTMWVQETQTCDHDTGDSCSSLQSESSSSTTESSSDQQSSSSPSSTEQPNKQEDENSNGPSSESTPTGSSDNNEKCTAEGFYANKNDCKKFYRCVDNGNGGFTKYDFTCGEGTAWDSDIQSCNHISEVKSCQGQQQETSQPMQDEQVSQSPGETQTSTSGPATEGSKPASNDKCEKEGYYGNSQDCTKFYRCVDNGNGGFTKYDFDCGEGTIWDQDVTTCNHPRDVSNPSCQQSDNSESSTSSSSTTSSSTSSSGTSSSGTSSSSTTESSSSDCSGSTKKPAKNNVNCTKAGYYPDPDDCKKFYRCVDWDGDGKKFSVYHFDCGEGTIWDPALDTCNHEDSVYPPRDCSGGSQSQGENVDQETTKSTTTTTTESGTTQESTTEQTTQETTTTEQTTSSEHTTTEKTTTSEQTTTQQSTTSEQTTTQQSTTSEQTTTQQSTTSEQTTTQQSTTSEQTTTQQSTTSEQTTTQHTTTEESTEKQTTTEQTTTSEQTTTQESTTEQTTESDQSSTTQQTTNTQGTTTESTTESTTTEGTTTAGTTEQSTTSQTDETESTDSTTSTTTSSTDESTTESSGDQTTESPSDKECPETEDDQNLFVCPTSFKRHPKYCNMFYQCTEDDDTHDVQIATFHCPNNTIYDESKTQCVEEKKADKKCNGEMARKRRLKRYNTVSKEPIIVTNERLKCPAPGHYPFEKGECSPAFLKCQTSKTGKIRGFIYQCPQDHVYWSVSRRCEQKSNVRDCKKSHNDWKGRWEIPVERRNVAP
ncbi:chitin binding peritrophin-A domain-containing protein [Phthorimaea operculella]|nr:chitin binding peritrophin-A domain-containing protein [Phthorimaea operculella]